MVKIPALELDGQNWKIYRAKLLEHAATQNLLNVLAGGPDEDWEGCNALLHELLHDTIPISIYIRLRRNTAHQVFKNLAKRFRDRDPIADPRAKKFATCANEDKRSPSAESSTSENAAAERLANAEREDLPTKDLTQGTKDVDDRNVGREDPRMSPEASAKGTSAECANGTLVLLESAPHETQNEPQDSPQVTPRLPTEGKPSECEREVAESVVTAERTKGTVEKAEPRETVADVDGKAALGREPVERVHRVDEGDEERERKSRLQQTNLHDESCQHNKNANADVPSAYKLPLEGEWTVYASGEARDPRGSASAPNATPECMHHPSELREAEDAKGVESEGCERDTSEWASVDELNAIVECCQQLCMADGNPGRGIQPADVPNESDPLVTRSVELYVENGETSVLVHLRGASWRADDTNGAGHGAEGLTGETDVSRGSTDMLGTSNSTGTAGISHGDGAGTYLDAGGAKRVIDATVGVGSHADASNGHTDVPSVQTNALTTANAKETVSTPRKRPKPPDSPSRSAKWTPDEPDGCGSHADASSVRTDAHCGGNETETAANETERVRTRRIGSKAQYSPGTRETTTPKRPRRWKRVSAGDIDVYVPSNAPIEVLGTASRRIVFGRVESGGKAIAPSVESETAGDGDGDGYGDDGDVGDVDDTTSGDGVDSTRVNAAQLATESQHTRSSRILRRNDLPVSSRPPIHLESRPYGHVRRRRRRGRLKIERINVSQVQQRETTYLERPCTTQPPRDGPNRAYGVYRPRRRRGRIKIVPINVSRTLENTYLGRDIALRSIWRPKKSVRRLDKFTFKYRMPGERWRDDGDHG